MRKIQVHLSFHWSAPDSSAIPLSAKKTFWPFRRLKMISFKPSSRSINQNITQNILGPQGFIEHAFGDFQSCPLSPGCSRQPSDWAPKSLQNEWHRNSFMIMQLMRDKMKLFGKIWYLMASNLQSLLKNQQVWFKMIVSISLFGPALRT